MNYKNALRAKGIKPIPPVDKLRTIKRPGDAEQTPRGWHIHEDLAAQ